MTIEEAKKTLENLMVEAGLVSSPSYHKLKDFLYELAMRKDN